MKELTKIK